MQGNVKSAEFTKDSSDSAESNNFIDCHSIFSKRFAMTRLERFIYYHAKTYNKSVMTRLEAIPPNSIIINEAKSVLRNNSFIPANPHLYSLKNANIFSYILFKYLTFLTLHLKKKKKKKTI